MVTLCIDDSRQISIAISGMATWSAQFRTVPFAGAEASDLAGKALDCLPRFADC